MARQMGIIKLKGTIGGMTFYKTSADGHLVREKGGIEKSRIESDPAFQRTRENGSEFGRAGKAGKMLRTTLRALLLSASDSRMTSRLHQQMIKVIQEDTVNERGLRNVIDGEAELLAGFEFNARGKLGTTMFAPYEAAIDRVSGELTVDIAPFIPANLISAPSGTTHYKIVSGGAEIDFENEVFTVDTKETAILPWDALQTIAVAHVNQVTAASTKPLFIALGIKFFQQVNGEMYSLKNGAYNPLSLVKVSGL